MESISTYIMRLYQELHLDSNTLQRSWNGASQILPAAFALSKGNFSALAMLADPEAWSSMYSIFQNEEERQQDERKIPEMLRPLLRMMPVTYIAGWLARAFRTTPDDERIKDLIDKAEDTGSSTEDGVEQHRRANYDELLVTWATAMDEAEAWHAKLMARAARETSMMSAHVEDSAFGRSLSSNNLRASRFMGDLYIDDVTQFKSSVHTVRRDDSRAEVGSQLWPFSSNSVQKFYDAETGELMWALTGLLEKDSVLTVDFPLDKFFTDELQRVAHKVPEIRAAFAHAIDCNSCPIAPPLLIMSGWMKSLMSAKTYGVSLIWAQYFASMHEFYERFVASAQPTRGLIL